MPAPGKRRLDDAEHVGGGHDDTAFVGVSCGIVPTTKLVSIHRGDDHAFGRGLYADAAQGFITAPGLLFTYELRRVPKVIGADGDGKLGGFGGGGIFGGHGIFPFVLSMLCFGGGFPPEDMRQDQQQGRCDGQQHIS